MKNGVLARRRDLKNDARVFEGRPKCASQHRGPIEITISSQNQSVIRIRAIGLIEGVDDFELTGRCDPVYDATAGVSIRAYAPVSSVARHAVKVAVHALHRRGNRSESVDIVSAAKGVIKIRYFTSSGHLEDVSRIKIFSLSRAPEVAVRPQRQAALRADAVSPTFN